MCGNADTDIKKDLRVNNERFYRALSERYRLYVPKMDIFYCCLDVMMGLVILDLRNVENW